MEQVSAQPTTESNATRQKFRGHDTACSVCGHTWDGGGVCPIHRHGRNVLEAAETVLARLTKYEMDYDSRRILSDAVALVRGREGGAA